MAETIEEIVAEGCSCGSPLMVLNRETILNMGTISPKLQNLITKENPFCEIIYCPDCDDFLISYSAISEEKE